MQHPFVLNEEQARRKMIVRSGVRQRYPLLATDGAPFAAHILWVVAEDERGVELGLPQENRTIHVLHCHTDEVTLGLVGSIAR